MVSLKYYNKYKKSYGGREKYFPCKYKKDMTSDCVIRAVAHAMEKDYMDVMRELFALGLEIGEVPNSKKCYPVYLERNGFKKHSPFKDERNKKFEVRYFPVDKSMNYVILTRGHLTAIVKGVHLDSWNCGEWCANTYYSKG